MITVNTGHNTGMILKKTRKTCLQGNVGAIYEAPRYRILSHGQNECKASNADGQDGQRYFSRVPTPKVAEMTTEKSLYNKHNTQCILTLL